MKLSKTTSFSLRIILLFVIAMFVSFIPDYLHSFFGDWHCTGSGILVFGTNGIGHFAGCNYSPFGQHTETWHWGYRHYLFAIMGVVLFIAQVIDIITFLEKE